MKIVAFKGIVRTPGRPRKNDVLLFILIIIEVMNFKKIVELLHDVILKILKFGNTSEISEWFTVQNIWKLPDLRKKNLEDGKTNFPNTLHIRMKIEWEHPPCECKTYLHW